MSTFILDLDRPSPVKAARAATALVDRPYTCYLLVRTKDRDPTPIGAMHTRNLKPEHAERIMQMVRVLLTLKRGQPFDLDVYVDDCGTAACACGWAMLDPWFQNNMPADYDDIGADPAGRRRLRQIANKRGVGRVPPYWAVASWVVGDRLLGSLAFQPHRYPVACRRSRAAVIERLRLFLNLAGYTGRRTLGF